MSAGWDDRERAALVALLRTRPENLTWPQLTAEVDAKTSALAVWQKHHPADLFDTDLADPAITQAEADIARWHEDGHGFLTFLDEQYPAQLREVHDLPPVLFHRGTLAADEAAISVVGSRAASERGLGVARAISTGLVERGITVVAGLAKGIDTAAHVAALDAGGRTVAVIGTGITRYYPTENRALQDRIAAEGLLLSQFWPDTPPTKATFPMRNAVMSGYGCATIVVEAGEHSGARIQARQAITHGRPVILTDIVVHANTWARQLVGRPGVEVVSGTAEAMAAVENLADRQQQIDTLLAAVADMK